VIKHILTKKTIFLTIIAIFTFSACEDSQNESTPESANISGTVTFEGEWPTAGPVFISLNVEWPPRSAGPPYSIMSLNEPVSSYNYEFSDVAFGEYGSIAVSWKDPNDDNPATNQKVIGAYGGSIQSGFMDATKMSFSEDNAELEEANFSADFRLIGPS
tara:strand:+ start:11297 stop:11773 length:477 start_codon:yes stop_codon:yes gene_type:complete